MADEFDPKKFNEDPAYESKRNEFDSMLAGSLARLRKKQEDEERGKKPTNFFDWLFSK